MKWNVSLRKSTFIKSTFTTDPVSECAEKKMEPVLVVNIRTIVGHFSEVPDTSEYPDWLMSILAVWAIRIAF